MLAFLDSRRGGIEKFVHGRAAALTDTAPGSIANGFFTPAESIAKAAVGLGPQTAGPLCALFEPYLPTALKECADGPTDENVVTPMGVLNYVSVARCCGAVLPGEAIGIETHWLPILASLQQRMTEKESYSMAFAALALGAFERVPTFIGGGPLPDSVEPGQKFQLNVQKFVRYLAAAAGKGMKAEDVTPAFREFVLVFPLKVGAKSLGWVDLLNAARAYYVHFERRPVETVAPTLHAFVTGLAAGN